MFAVFKPAMFYEVDFGDGWRHRIVLEKRIEDAGDVPVPVGLAGERAWRAAGRAQSAQA